VTEIASIYGPVADDVPLVGQRLRELALGQHELLGETLAYVFETGGKRIRPALVLLSGRLGTYPREELITLAASLEVVHTATLVHDDTIDGALTRRGMKTISAMWDSKVAILIGDFLFAQSAELAARLNNVRIMSLLSETVMAMSSGELRQFAATSSRAIDEADYYARIRGKTASLFAMCCEGAAIISGQDEGRVQALHDYGLNLGLAFQIVDDVLDVAGDSETLGQPAGNDLMQGTVTLPVILFARELPPHSQVLEDLRMGRNTERVVQAVRESGAPDRALLVAREHCRKAQEALLRSVPGSEARDALLDLTATVLDRRR
jgi:geranylgeranyl pyrophosphate synthase